LAGLEGEDLLLVDPQEELVGNSMTQYMMSFDVAQKDFQVLAYQALLD